MDITTKSLMKFKLDNLYMHSPGIKIETNINDSPRKVQSYHFCRSQPKKRENSKLIGLSNKVFEMLGINPQMIKCDPDSALVLSGSKLLPQSEPICNNYCGIQFGNWAGQLGDGRAHTLGHIKSEGIPYELQLKGSGLSPFSRHADGNSVISSAIREFLASQLMEGLGIPTTRAASLVITNQDVARDPLYNGKIKIQKAAIILRVCPSFLRFGSLQICNKDITMNAEDCIKNRQLLAPLCDYLLDNYYLQLQNQQGDKYQLLFKKITHDSAKLVALWQSVGFCHGVLNTDNMSMMGVTIDYGPYGFIDYFSKDFVPNLSDDYERYSYRRQPQIVRWNLLQLAQCMDVLIPKNLLHNIIEKQFNRIYEQTYYSLMLQKLGLKHQSIIVCRQVIDNLFEIMHECGSNFTNVFKILSKKQQNCIELLIKQSASKQFLVNSIRAYPSLINMDQNQFLNDKSCFNINFIKDQPERIKFLKMINNESIEQKYNREKQLWQKWLLQYNKYKPNYEGCKIIQYVLLNHITSSIIKDLQNLKQYDQKINLISKLLMVMQNPYQYNQWFENNYWLKEVVPIKLTCSS